MSTITSGASENRQHSFTFVSGSFVHERNVVNYYMLLILSPKFVYECYATKSGKYRIPEFVTVIVLLHCCIISSLLVRFLSCFITWTCFTGRKEYNKPDIALILSFSPRFSGLGVTPKVVTLQGH